MFFYYSDFTGTFSISYGYSLSSVLKFILFILIANTNCRSCYLNSMWTLGRKYVPKVENFAKKNVMRSMFDGIRILIMINMDWTQRGKLWDSNAGNDFLCINSGFSGNIPGRDEREKEILHQLFIQNNKNIIIFI